MANLWKNDKQLKIIEMSWKECVAITDSWSLCYVCGQNSSEEPIYYIALLNEFYCKNCLTAYLKEAKRYKSDFQKEQLNFINIRNKLIDLGTWND